MDKLSELSKPVAWKFKNADGADRVSLERKANIYGRHDFQPLYSQEYVSALTQRIAELEAGHQEAAKQIASWRRIAKQNIEEREKDLAALDAERQKITVLEAKLATPVRLPEPCVYEVNGTRFYDRLSEAEVIASLREQGFTVEGDE